MKDEMLYIAEHGDASHFHLIGHLFLFIDYLSRSSVTMHLSSSGKVRDFYIKEALNYIEQNFQNDISVEGIAQFCGLNRTYFGRDLQRSRGKVPAGISLKLPHDKSRGTAEADPALHQRHRKRCGIPEPAPLLAGI